MRCDHDRLRIALLIDGELPARERDAVSAQAAECADCRRTRDELTWLRGRLRQARQTPAAALQERLRARLEYEAADMATEPESPLSRQRWPVQILERLRPSMSAYMRQAAAIFAACILSVAATLWWTSQSGLPADQAHDVLAAHVRSLLQDNAVQVASLDTHTVKPWFNGRIDYTPVVKDLSADGFKLAGGRLDYVDGRRVAALVYLHRLHKISLFIWPADGPDAAPAPTQIEGYNLLTWTRAGMRFWAISDVDAAELQRLPDLL
ncbi:MAG TPA: anti-sigma factor [Nordella sp.]|nr:anti-sigma factor [Nordella sp.]